MRHLASHIVSNAQPIIRIGFDDANSTAAEVDEQGTIALLMIWSNLRPSDFASRLAFIWPAAIIAVARKLAIILHRMWRDQMDFRWSAA